MKILICDDHPVFREGLREVLAEIAAGIAEAPDASAALERVAADPEIELVLLDLAMPGTDGWTAFRRLRERHPTVPVVIVSGSEDPADMRRALEEGPPASCPSRRPPRSCGGRSRS